MTTEVPTRTQPLVRRVTTELPCEPQSASTARKLVRDNLARWELDHLDGEAALIVTELVSNAARISSGRSTMRVDIARVTNRRRQAVRISVRDGSRVLPVLVLAGHEAESGRGLFLVDNLAALWGIELDPYGKTMWADISVEQR
ncbi:ATP-binding protein [Kitasatospora sp. NPDC058218]|uniref:ATP-binding protein n=1 Tax=Kitasatospora sp. NPDC058218 TaxID=3346385 RepID=UPI0036D8F7FD